MKLKKGIICILIVAILGCLIYLNYQFKMHSVKTTQINIVYMEVIDKASDNEFANGNSRVILKDNSSNKKIECDIERIWKVTRIGDSIKMKRIIKTYNNNEVDYKYEFINKESE